MDELEHQDLIAQAQSMEKIASILIHELAQPLTAINAYISGCIYRLSNGSEDHEPLLKAMNKILQNIEYAEHITHRMKTNIKTGL